MSEFQLRVFVLCLIVFILLVCAFSLLISMVIRLLVKLIVSGSADEDLKKEYELQLSKAKMMRAFDITAKVLSGIVCVCLFSLLLYALYFTFTGMKKVGDTPQLKVVNSTSMAKKRESNKYLFENNLDDQIQLDWLILLRKLPEEKDLKLYDIVSYERDGILILHRIVKINEPESPEGHRTFLFQGDAVYSYDNKPVTYGQMKGIYRGEHVVEIGSFVKFLKDPAGYICIILVILVTLSYPFVEKRIERERIARLRFLGYDIPMSSKKGKASKVREEKIVFTYLSTPKGSGGQKPPKPQEEDSGKGKELDLDLLLKLCEVSVKADIIKKWLEIRGEGEKPEEEIPAYKLQVIFDDENTEMLPEKERGGIIKGIAVLSTKLDIARDKLLKKEKEE